MFAGTTAAFAANTSGMITGCHDCSGNLKVTAGPAGADGQPGQNGASVYGVLSATVEVFPSDDQFGEPCPRGKTVVGGGYRTVGNTNLVVTGSYPGASVWVIEVNDEASMTTPTEIFAICVIAS